MFRYLLTIPQTWMHRGKNMHHKATPTNPLPNPMPIIIDFIIIVTST